MSPAPLPFRSGHLRRIVARRASTGWHGRVQGARPGYGARMTDRRSGRDRDWTDKESEGQPATEDQPPGIDAETALEGEPLPGDHPVGATEVGVTEREQAVPESLEERVRRERPDVPPVPPDDPGGRLPTGGADHGDPLEGEWAPDDAGLSAEEAAVHVEEG